MTEAEPPESAWQRSSYCNASGCVEVSQTELSVFVRDGKEVPGPVLRYSLTEWAAFVAGVKQGEFDVAAP